MEWKGYGDIVEMRGHGILRKQKGIRMSVDLLGLKFYLRHIGECTKN